MATSLCSYRLRNPIGAAHEPGTPLRARSTRQRPVLQRKKTLGLHCHQILCLSPHALCHKSKNRRHARTHGLPRRPWDRSRGAWIRARGAVDLCRRRTRTFQHLGTPVQLRANQSQGAGLKVLGGDGTEATTNSKLLAKC